MTTHKARQFSVDEAGAYVTELSDNLGHPILFPRVTLDGKLRGGCHMCYPYFGPDQAGVLPQHGFGRAVQWRVEVSADHREVSCTYDATEDKLFSGLHAQLLYRLGPTDDTFTATLTVTNCGDHPCPVTPGFHPYFMIDPTDVRLNGAVIDLANFAPFQSFPDRELMTLETMGRTVAVASSDMTHMVVWSDARDAYLCVEPTRSGNGFDSLGGSPGVILPGETVRYTYTISWQ